VPEGPLGEHDGPPDEIEGPFDEHHWRFDELGGPLDDQRGSFCSLDGPIRDDGRPPQRRMELPQRTMRGGS
jgi:hypothetical protein